MEKLTSVFFTEKEMEAILSMCQHKIAENCCEQEEQNCSDCSLFFQDNCLTQIAYVIQEKIHMIRKVEGNNKASQRVL